VGFEGVTSCMFDDVGKGMALKIREAATWMKIVSLKI